MKKYIIRFYVISFFFFFRDPALSFNTEGVTEESRPTADCWSGSETRLGIQRFQQVPGYASAPVSEHSIRGS